MRDIRCGMSTTARALANADVHPDSLRMSTIQHFFDVLHNVKSLVSMHGPYTTIRDTAMFTRAPVPRTCKTIASTKDLAISFAAAQDSLDGLQLDGPANNDLVLFGDLWETAIAILDELLEGGELDQESFGWGIYGLASGYMHPPSNNLASQNLFWLHKYRLHTALTLLPSMDSSVRRRNEYVVSEKTRVDGLVKARKEVHLCANLLLQRFRQEDWRRVRWWHVIAVAERWIGRLGLGSAGVPLRKEGELSQMILDEGKSEAVAEEQSCI